MGAVGIFLIVLIVWLVGAEATSQILYGTPFLVDEGSNSLSDSQDWIVALWPIWVPGTAFLVVAALIWLVPKLPGAARWTVRHLRYIPWSKSPKRWRAAISEGRKMDDSEAEAARDGRSPSRRALDEQRKQEELKRKRRGQGRRDRSADARAKYEAAHHAARKAAFDSRSPERRALDEQRKQEELERKRRRQAEVEESYLRRLSENEQAKFHSLTPGEKRKVLGKHKSKIHQEKIRAEAAAAQTRRAQRDLVRRANLGLRSEVKSRIPKDADDFESVSAEWAQSCGVNARRTPKGPDGGLDLIGPSFAGQCKFHPSNKVGAPDVQQLAGAARQAQKNDMAFFHYGPGYTEAAIEAARSLGVQLWEMDVDRNTFRKVT